MVVISTVAPAEGVGATVSAPVRETVEAVDALKSPCGVMARELANYLRLDKSNVSRRLRVAADDSYLRNLEDKRGKPGRWVVGDPLPESADLLPDPAQLATDDTTADLGGCAVALDSDGENDTVHCRVCGDEIPEHMHSARARGDCGRARCIAAVKFTETESGHR